MAVSDARPDSLPYGHHLYFQSVLGQRLLSVALLRPSKPPGSQPRAERVAATRMAAAARGEREPRAPLLVRPARDGTYEVLDGNATLTVAARSGWPDVPVIFAAGETDLHAVPPLRVLALDGGGIRGAIPARVLTEIESLAARPICELFDLIAGTSTGGILALGLTLPGGPGRPRYAARDLLRLYHDEGEKIFASGVAQRAYSLGGLRRSKYAARGIDDVLGRYFGEAKLSAALTNVMVPAYDIEERCRYWFKSRKAKADPNDDTLMADAARATSAAPTYFPPAHVARSHRERVLIDGGVFANNPALAALADARDGFGAGKLMLLSIGTGEMTEALPYTQARRWGLAGWARPILDVVFDGVADEIHHTVRKLIGGQDYLRLQLRLDRSTQRMDNASPDNVRRLQAHAEAMMFDHRTELAAFVKRLGAIVSPGAYPPTP
jgi:predicted acylesterase/phospholipase RssA